jgi:hypothetical protein
MAEIFSRENLIWSLFLAIGAATGVATFQLDGPAKLEFPDMLGGIMTVAAGTVFVLALARFLLREMMLQGGNG